MSQSFKVQIAGQTYHLRGDLDPAYAAELAAFVDERMAAISASATSVDSLRVAVLTALSIADELHDLRRQHGQLSGEIRGRAERCLTLVERALDRSA
jgi:cell division protein ZapA